MHVWKVIPIQVRQKSVALLVLSEFLLGQTSQSPIAFQHFVQKSDEDPILEGDIYPQQSFWWIVVFLFQMQAAGIINK